MNLNQARIVVTRPAQQAGPLQNLLQQAGATPVSLPLLTIDTEHPEINRQQLKQHFLDLDQYHSVIFVSANAAKLAADWIDQYWPQLPLGIHWLAVGEATARELARQHIPTFTPETGMNSESLLSLAELQQLDHQRILICRGVGGLEILGNTLEQRGAQIDYAELYQRRPCQYSSSELANLLLHPSADAILISSGEGLQNLDQQVSEKLNAEQLEQLRMIRLVVPSQRVAALAESLGYMNFQVAANATDQAMLSSLASVPNS